MSACGSSPKEQQNESPSLYSTGLNLRASFENIRQRIIDSHNHFFGNLHLVHNIITVKGMPAVYLCFRRKKPFFFEVFAGNNNPASNKFK
jgi:hypothetical protein